MFDSEFEKGMLQEPELRYLNFWIHFNLYAEYKHKIARDKSHNNALTTYPEF